MTQSFPELARQRAFSRFLFLTLFLPHFNLLEESQTLRALPPKRTCVYISEPV